MSTPSHPTGRLMLVPTPLADVASTPLVNVLPQASIATAASLDHWIVENAKTARAFLGAINALQPLRVPLQQQTMGVLPKHTQLNAAALRAMLQPCMRGIDMGLMSEAGAPCVADPGALVVATAHDLNISVVPLVGPSALLLALMASGLDGQRFAFHGYLPVDAEARDKQIRLLERESAQRQQTQLFIETPYRNTAVLHALVKTLQPSTRVTVASNLTAPHATVQTRKVAQWREVSTEILDKIPAVFGFLAR